MRRALFVLLTACGAVAHAQTTPNPILFVTQVPVPADFAAIGSTFANHIPSIDSAYRGGDLWIRYGDGTLRNLTAAAGFGSAGVFQGATAIAVRDPAVDWNGTRAVFAMVVGAPPAQFVVQPYRWQLYEITSFGAGQTPVITLVANQPPFNNVMPAYLSDGDLVFASDRPRGGEAHLYPQQDEYESTETVTGLWRLDRQTGALRLLDHSPSGDFDPMVDSFGRLLFTRWDHLQRDQQADAQATYQTFDWLSEAANAPTAPSNEVFPELRVVPPGSPVNGHRFNNFFPWEIGQDGSAAEFLNHLGRHELQRFFDRSFTTDPNLVEFNDVTSGRTNPRSVENIFQLSEDPTQPGRFVAIDAPEFDTHAAGQLLRFSAPPTANADDIVIEWLTPESTAGTNENAPDHSGHYRNPIVLSDGRIVVAHAPQRGGVATNYRFRLRFMTAGTGGFQTAGAALTSGIVRNVQQWDPDALVTYDGELWELSPVEVRARTAPAPVNEPPLAVPEQLALAAANVAQSSLRQFMRQNGLGLVVVRNAVDRDKADRQQPYNLRVPGGVQSIGSPGIVYDVAHFQMIQGDQVRGRGGTAQPVPGRRVLARFLHDAAAVANNLPNASGPPGSAPIFPDGSVAMFVPARRALSWQSTAPNGTPVVRERYWLTVQPGEVRMCEGCHGINRFGQAGQPDATNTPLALTALLQNWSTANGGWIFADGVED
jgi:hypothetical protein